MVAEKLIYMETYSLWLQRTLYIWKHIVYGCREPYIYGNIQFTVAENLIYMET